MSSDGKAWALVVTSGGGGGGSIGEGGGGADGGRIHVAEYESLDAAPISPWYWQRIVTAPVGQLVKSTVAEPVR